MFGIRHVFYWIEYKKEREREESMRARPVERIRTARRSKDSSAEARSPNMKYKQVAGGSSESLNFDKQHKRMKVNTTWPDVTLYPFSHHRSLPSQDAKMRQWSLSWWPMLLQWWLRRQRMWPSRLVSSGLQKESAEKKRWRKPERERERERERKRERETFHQLSGRKSPTGPTSLLYTKTWPRAALSDLN